MFFKKKDKRIIQEAKFKRDTIFLNNDGSLHFVSYRGPLDFSGFNLHKKEYEAAGCPKVMTVTITTEDIPVKETYSFK